MDKETQISALVSRTTRELLERRVRATGVKKGHLVEQALQHYPILEKTRTAKPVKALRRLMRDAD